MKQRHHISLAFAALLGIVAGGCSEEVDLWPLPAASDVEIVPMAAVSGTRAALSGAQDGPGFPSSTDKVFAVSAFLSKTDSLYDGGKLVYYENPNDEQIEGIGANLPYFLNQPIRTDENGNFHFNTENGQRYYPEDGSHVYFYAFSPGCAVQDTTKNKKVSWTLTGQEDIMYARDLRGIRKAHGSDFDSIHQPQPEFKFEHLMTRLNFRCRRETGFADYMYITSITVKNQNTVATLDLKTGIPSFSRKSDELCYELPVPHMIVLAEGYNDVSSLMLEPSSYYEVIIGLEGGNTIHLDLYSKDLKVDSDDYHQEDIDIDKTEFKKGYAYNVNMKFLGVQVSIESITVDRWNEGGNFSGKIKPN